METIVVEQQDRVRIIRLNRAAEANCVNGQMAAELADAARDCDLDPSVRAVLLTGTGRFFCAGGDVKAMASFGDRAPAGIKRIADDFHRAVSTFARMQAPLVVAVNGVAAGAGFSLALIGDIVFASRTATFTMAYSRIGLSPDGSSTWYLPRLAGMRRAQELAFTNRTVTAEEAVALGIATSQVDPDELTATALATARQCAAGSPESHAAIKALLLASSANSLETQMEVEGRYISACAGTANGREGIRAFVERRSPRYD